MYTAEMNVTYCDHCGAPVPAGSAFCEECGAFIEYPDMQASSGSGRKLMIALIAVCMVAAGCLSGLVFQNADAETADHKEKAKTEQACVNEETADSEDADRMGLEAADPKAEAAYAGAQNPAYDGQKMPAGQSQTMPAAKQQKNPQMQSPQVKTPKQEVTTPEQPKDTRTAPDAPNKKTATQPGKKCKGTEPEPSADPIEDPEDELVIVVPDDDESDEDEDLEEDEDLNDDDEAVDDDEAADDDDEAVDDGDSDDPDDEDEDLSDDDESQDDDEDAVDEDFDDEDSGFWTWWW